ncbi:kinase-like domain-containing protein, partial [Scleroderma citrinum]
NVLIFNDGHALLTDFGLSTLPINTFSMPIEPHFRGTCDWMAPEILHGEGPSVASDIWAFGMTMLVCSRYDSSLGVSNVSTGVVHLRILQGAPDQPTNELMCFHLMDAWWDVCLLCWASNPLSQPGMLEIIQKL